MEKQLAETQPRELAAVRQRVEELQAAQAVKAGKVWDFLGQTEITLVPLGFSPLRSGDLVQDVSVTLPLLNSTGAKMLKLEEVIGGKLEEEGRALAEVVVEHVLACFRSRDPQLSLESVVEGHVIETEEVARARIP
jgi:hypothetical protein